MFDIGTLSNNLCLIIKEFGIAQKLLGWDGLEIESDNNFSNTTKDFLAARRSILFVGNIFISVNKRIRSLLQS